MDILIFSNIWWKKGADIKACRYDTALRKASINRHFDIVKYLIEKGADIEAEDVDNFPAVHKSS